VPTEFRAGVGQSLDIPDGGVLGADVHVVSAQEVQTPANPGVLHTSYRCEDGVQPGLLQVPPLTGGCAVLPGIHVLDGPGVNAVSAIAKQLAGCGCFAGAPAGEKLKLPVGRASVPAAH